MRISDWSSDVCSSDLKTWTFKLRDGLTFHDGAPVTAEDCVASLRRWGARDGMGQQLMNVTETMTAVDERTFEMKLGVAYGLVLESIGKISSNVPFIMPKRVAENDPFERSEEHTSELQSLMRISYDVFCLKKKKRTTHETLCTI